MERKGVGDIAPSFAEAPFGAKRPGYDELLKRRASHADTPASDRLAALGCEGRAAWEEGALTRSSTPAKT
jgi:hypothetical protein